MKNVGFGCIILAVLACEKKGERDTWVPKPNIVNELDDLKKIFHGSNRVKMKYNNEHL